MTHLTDLGLTPTQYSEVEQLEPELVASWLEALDAMHGIKSPAGWLLAGIRSGQPPQAAVDTSKAKQVHLAEVWIRNAGIHCHDAANVQDELFGDRGRLKPWAHDTQLRSRMTELWTTERPRGQQTEHELAARGQRWREAHTE